MNEMSKRGVCVPLDRPGIILIPNYPFWLLDSASIKRIAGDKQAADCPRADLRPGWNFLRKRK
jgi:hypothetical protein